MSRKKQGLISRFLDGPLPNPAGEPEIAKVANGKPMKSAMDWFGEPVRYDEKGRPCLTDLWKAAKALDAMKPESERDARGWEHKEVRQWARFSGKPFLQHVANKQRVCEAHLLHVRKGRNGGTFAHPTIFLAYAAYISKEFEERALTVYARYLAKDRTLATEVYDRACVRDQAWINERLAGKKERLRFTDVLTGNGVTPIGIGVCTNEIYRPILGADAKTLKSVRCIGKGGSIRDTNTTLENTAVRFAEIMAGETIDASEPTKGDGKCSMVCKASATKVGDLVSAHNDRLSKLSKKRKLVPK